MSGTGSPKKGGVSAKRLLIVVDRPERSVFCFLVIKEAIHGFEIEACSRVKGSGFPDSESPSRSAWLVQIRNPSIKKGEATETYR